MDKMDKFDFLSLANPTENLDKQILFLYYNNKRFPSFLLYEDYRTECVERIDINNNDDFLNSVFGAENRFKKLLRYLFPDTKQEVLNKVYDKYFKNNKDKINRFLRMSVAKAAERLCKIHELTRAQLRENIENIYSIPEFYPCFRSGDKLLIVRGIGVLLSGYTKHFISCMRIGDNPYNFVNFMVFGGIGVYHIRQKIFHNRYELIGRALAIPMVASENCNKKFVCWLRPYGTLNHSFFKVFCSNLIGPIISNNVFGNAKTIQCFISNRVTLSCNNVVGKTLINNKLRALKTSIHSSRIPFYCKDNFLMFRRRYDKRYLYSKSYFNFVK